MDLPVTVFLYSAGPTVLGKRYRQSCPLWPTETRPPEKTQLKHASTVRKSESRRREKVNHNGSGLVSFGVFAFSG